MHFQFDFYFDPNVTTIGKQVDEITVRNSDGAEFRETVSTSKRPIYDPHGSSFVKIISGICNKNTKN